MNYCRKISQKMYQSVCRVQIEKKDRDTSISAETREKPRPGKTGTGKNRDRENRDREKPRPGKPRPGKIETGKTETGKNRDRD